MAQIKIFGLGERLAPRRMALTHAMVNGFGFGGVNATLILRRWTEAA